MRASCLGWAGPLCLALVLAFYFNAFQANYQESKGPLGDAPSLVSSVLYPCYVLAYAAASCLGAWESGRVRDAGVWRSAPVRSRYRIAADALAPVVALAWGMLLLPVVMALVQERTPPTLAALPLLGLGLAVAAAHATIGFAVGLVAPRLVAAPLLAAGVFYFVAGSVAYEAFWPRHMLGQFDTLMYAELPTPAALFAQLLPTVSLAAGLGLLWLTRRGGAWRLAAPVASCVLVLAATGTSYALVRDWPAAPQLTTGNAAVTCSGSQPRVCTPAQQGAADPDKVRREASVVFTRLREAGVAARPPEVIRDRITQGRSSPTSDERTWWLELTASARQGTLRHALLDRAVPFSCPADAHHTAGELAARYSAKLWAARLTGTARQERAAQRAELAGEFANPDEALADIRSRVDTQRGKSADAQADWFTDRLRAACAGGGA